MAKKPASKSKAKKAKPGDPRANVVDAALELAGQLGWRDLRLDEIAEHAGIDMTELYRTLPSKSAIVGACMQRVDEAVASAGPADKDDPVKDRLFDVVMRRFDALQVNRDGIAAIARDLITDPVSLMCLMGRRRRSVNWMLELSGLSSDGFKGRMRARGLDVILLSTMRVWLKDDSQDMSATMAHLDRQLGKVDQFIGLLKNRGRSDSAQTQTG